MSQVNTNSIYDASGGSNAVLYGVAAPANSMGFRNRIINGNMTIDQRNAGASITIAASGSGYPVDRFRAANQTDGTFTVQQSTVAPVGFTNSVVATVTATDSSIGATQYAQLEQRIEGFNVADLGWGTANAQAVTISFQVRSSLTGTFCLALYNSNGSRCYVATYTVNSANTWESEAITVPGDTAGTWQTGSSTGIDLIFTLAVGSTYQQAAGAWGTTSFAIGTSGQTNFLGTNGATFYITGVQLEAGSVASPFERRDYGRELMMCQRYYYKVKPDATARLLSMTAQCYATTGFICYNQFPVTMRTRPTSLEQSGTASDYGVFNAGTSALTCNSVIAYNTNTTDSFGMSEGTVASGLVAGNATAVSTKTTSAYLAWSAEL